MRNVQQIVQGTSMQMTYMCSRTQGDGYQRCRNGEMQGHSSMKAQVCSVAGQKAHAGHFLRVNIVIPPRLNSEQL